MIVRFVCPPIAAALSLMLTTAPGAGQDPGASKDTPAAPPAVSVPVAPELIPVPLNEAIQKAANALMAKAPTTGSPEKPRELAIDPLIDGYTGAQNAATTKMAGAIASIVKQSYPHFKVVPFTSDNISKQPLVLIGTFRSINTKNVPTGPKDAFHIWLTLLDLKAGTVVSKGSARAVPTGIDVTPTQFFQDSPVWVADPAVSAYIKTCHTTKIGDPIDQVYADRILVASLISDAINAYNAKRYKDALDLYQSALRTPGGDQLRVHNGIYLANWRLKRTKETTAAFGDLVDHGLKSSKIAVGFLFTPNTTIFYTPKGPATPYSMWLKVIGEHSTAANACLEIVGHTSRTGPAAINDRLSVLRAQYVRDRLITSAPHLAPRTIATGVGSREVIVGTDTDGPHNALDRRVEFKPIKCAS